MKKLFNTAEAYVDDMLEGLVAAVPSLVRLPGTNVVVRRELRPKVGIVSGGGSGHEPAHAGFVGTGMLDGAVAGEVFTSPTPDQVLAAVRAVHTGRGVLLVVKNYTGDVLNFEMAAELAQAEGIRVERVIVNDDVAVDGSTYTVGRRGIAGTVLVHKIAGAAAESGKDLDEVKRVAEKAIGRVRSMGMALAPCTVPASGKPSFTLADGEMEIGMGIHGEPGTERREMLPSDAVADLLLDRIFKDGAGRPGEKVAVVVNGLGATPLSELYIFHRRVAAVLAERGVLAHRVFVGEYMTSLEMAGVSVSLLSLDSELEAYLDAPAATPALHV